MKKLLPGSTSFRPAIIAAAFFALSAGLPAAFANQAPSDEVPNLIQVKSGTEIECTTPDGRIELVTPETHHGPSAMIMNDETLSCPLQPGHTTFVIKLPSTALLDRFTFVNENATAAGDLKISVSNYQLPASSPKWVEVDGNISFSRKRLFNLSMVGVEAHYLRLSFNVENGGRIASLGLYGGRKLDHSVWTKAADQQLALVSNTTTSRHLESKLNFDYAALHAKGRVVYVSSGSITAAQKMIDDNKATGFRFSSSDPRPTVVVELARTEELHRVTARYKFPYGGRVDVYLLDKMNKDAAEIDQAVAVASATGQNADGEAAVEFDPEGARYVALRFSAGDSKDGGASEDFEIAEISAFGDTPYAMMDATDAPDVYAANYTGTQFSGSGSPDLSNALGTLAIPPTLPVVSP